MDFEMTQAGSGNQSGWRFHVGGPLSAESRCYVRRNADDEVESHLSAGRHCHVLGPRQIGKSSLRLRVQHQLENGGVRSVGVDLGALGINATAAQWFGALGREIAEALDCASAFEPFWRDHGHTVAARGWSTFLRDFLPSKATGQVALLFDDVDVVADSGPLAGAFFAAIRELHSKRGKNDDLQQIAICLIGGGRLKALAKSEVQSPFPFSHEVLLDDFTPTQAKDLLPGLALAEDQAVPVLDAVMAWTDGHPFMTQKLCQRMVEVWPTEGRALKNTETLDARNEQLRKIIERIVDDDFLDERAPSNASICYASDYLSKNHPRYPLTDMSDLYRTLLVDGPVPWMPTLEEQDHLRLSGLAAVREQNGELHLRVRNEVFRRACDATWLKAKQGEIQFGDPLVRWQKANDIQKKDLLLRGEALKRARDWVTEQPDVGEEENRFLLASQSAAWDEEALEAQRQRLKAHRAWLVAALAGVVATACILIALFQHRYSAAERERQQLEDLVLQARLIIEPALREEALAQGLQLAARANGEPSRRELATKVLSEGLNMSSQTVLDGHQGRVNAVAFSPGGERAASAGDDGSARLWDGMTGALIASLKGHAGPVEDVVFSSDGSLLATSSDDHTARLWNGANGAPIATLKGHTATVREAAFSADGAILGTASDDGTARLWHADGNTAAVLTGHKGPVYTVALSETRVATAGDDGTARIWDLAGTPLATLSGHRGRINHVVFSPRGEILATSGEDSTVKLWDGVTGKLIGTLEGHSDQVYFAAFSGDGSKLVTGSWDQTARLWDVGEEKLDFVLREHHGSVNIVAFSGDGTRVATTCADQVTRVWDAGSGALLERLTGHGNAVVDVAFGGDGRRLLTGSYDGTARLWEMPRSKPVVALQGHRSRVGQIVYSRDGEWLATAGDDGFAGIWKAADGALVSRLQGHDGKVRSIALSPDRKRAVTGADDGARVWDPATGALVTKLPVEGKVHVVELSENGARFVTGGADGIVRLWDTETASSLRDFRGHNGQVFTVGIARDGTVVVSGGEDGVGRIWHEGREFPIELRGHTASIRSVSLTRDGARVVTASNDTTARVWDVRTGALVARLEGHTSYVITAQPSPDGAIVASAGWDRTVRLWDTATGRQLRVLALHTAPVRTLAFSRDGARLATSGVDGTVHVWDVQEDKQITWLQANIDVWSLAFSREGDRVAVGGAGESPRVYSTTYEGLIGSACDALKGNRGYRDTVKAICQF